MNKIKLVSLIILLACFLGEANSQKICEKGETVVENSFEGSFEFKKTIKLNGTCKRRVEFGDWSLESDGSLKAVNIEEQGHGPLMSYQIPITNGVIECEFKLPLDKKRDQHFRIFLTNASYRGHNVSAMSNLSTQSYQKGITLRYFKKGDNKKNIEEIDFESKKVSPIAGEWHKMRICLWEDEVQLSIDGDVVNAKNKVLKDLKNKVVLNFGKAGGEIRNFSISEAKE